MAADAKRKEARKRKYAHLENAYGAEDEGRNLETPDAGAPPGKKSRKAAIESATTRPGEPLSRPEEIANSVVPGSVIHGVAEVDSKPPAKKARFLCFVGNLPFTATTESVTQHFAKIKPRSIRHPTTKDTRKSKGFAFLEFDGYDRLKTCLSTFHHSNFNDGLSPARQINVELTAGGGGVKSKGRKAKLLQKNTRLNEQRKRRSQEAAAERGAEGAKKGMGSVGKGEGFRDAEEGSFEDQSAIHPSRRSRLSNI